MRYLWAILIWLALHGAAIAAPVPIASAPSNADLANLAANAAPNGVQRCGRLTPYDSPCSPFLATTSVCSITQFVGTVAPQGSPTSRLNVTVVGSGTLTVGLVMPVGIFQPGTVITGQISGTAGGVGVYALSQQFTGPPSFQLTVNGDGQSQVPTSDGGCWVQAAAGTGGTGNVTGPASSTAGAVASWGNTVGTLLASDTLTAYNPLITTDGFSVYNLTGANGANPRPSDWLNSVVGGAYAYLNQASMVYSVTNQGQPALFGASRSSNTAPPNTCCPIGVAATAVNDRTSVVQTAWPFYSTGARLTGTGTLVNEIDVSNLGTDFHDANPSVQPNGAVVGVAIQAGGEPAETTTAGADVGALLYLASNSTASHPQYIRHGIVFNFINTLFNPGVCTSNCPIIDTLYNTEIRWTADSGDVAQSFIRGNNGVTTAPSGIVMNQFGMQYVNGQGQILAAVSYDGSATSSTNGYPSLGIDAATHNALIGTGTGNGGSGQSIEIQAASGGSIILTSPLTFPTGTAGTVTPTFNTAPTGCTNVFWIGPYSTKNPPENANVYLAACHL